MLPRTLASDIMLLCGQAAPAPIQLLDNCLGKAWRLAKCLDPWHPHGKTEATNAGAY